MNERLQVYKCEKCGNVVEILSAAKGVLYCCGEPMKLKEEMTKDSSIEKHVPVVEEIEDGIKVTVGSTLHPMVEKHLIEWIEIVTDNGVFRKYLKPGDKPEAIFPAVGKMIKVREYCNLHGLWTN